MGFSNLYTRVTVVSSWSPPSFSRHFLRTSLCALERTDQKAVAATTIVWKETVTSGTYDAPKKTAALYAEDGVLWGTVSEEVRDTPEQIYAYFVSCVTSSSSSSSF